MLGSHGLFFGLVGWGAKTPLLDEVWQLEHELKAGSRTGLDEEDRAVFTRAFVAYPELGKGLSDGRKLGCLTPRRRGWALEGGAVLVRATGESLAVRVRMGETGGRVTFEGTGWRREVDVAEAGSRVELPAVGGAEVVMVRGASETDARMPAPFELDTEETP